MFVTKHQEDALSPLFPVMAFFNSQSIGKLFARRKVLDLSKLKAFADDKFAQMIEFLFESAKNIENEW